MKKELKVVLQNEVRTYLNYSLPLCAFMWNKKKKDWIYEHFTLIYSMRSKEGYIWFDYLESDDFLLGVLDKTTENIHTVKEQMSQDKNIVDHIKELLKKDYYVVVHADGYYLEGLLSFRKEHESAQSFIYGYDDKQQVFNGIGFLKNGNFGKIDFQYNSIEKAVGHMFQEYKSMPVWVEWYFVTKMKIKQHEFIYQPEVNIIVQDIRRYLYSEKRHDLIRPDVQREYNSEVLYGYEAQVALAQAFDELGEGRFVFDFRSVYLLDEHKILMLQKLTYIANRLDKKNISKIYLPQYQTIVEGFHDIKSRFLKNVLVDNKMNSIYGQLKNQPVIEKLKGKMIFLCKEEYRILESFLSEIEVI